MDIEVVSRREIPLVERGRNPLIQEVRAKLPLLAKDEVIRLVFSSTKESRSFQRLIYYYDKRYRVSKLSAPYPKLKTVSRDKQLFCWLEEPKTNNT